MSATPTCDGAVPRPPRPRYNTTSSATSGVGNRHGDSACSDDVTMSATYTVRIITIARCAVTSAPPARSLLLRRGYAVGLRLRQRPHRLRLARDHDQHVTQFSEVDDRLHLGV